MCVVGDSSSVLLSHRWARSISSPSCQEPSLQPAPLCLLSVYPWDNGVFMYITGIFQLTRYRLGNVCCLPLGTVLDGWCRHHLRWSVLGRFTGDGPTAPPTCPRLGMGQPQGTQSWTCGAQTDPWTQEPRAG